VINPAIRPFDDLCRCLGRWRNPHAGDDHGWTDFGGVAASVLRFDGCRE